jgi:hypothetical protein
LNELLVLAKQHKCCVIDGSEWSKTFSHWGLSLSDCRCGQRWICTECKGQHAESPRKR